MFIVSLQNSKLERIRNLSHLSKNQKRILNYLEIKPEMTTKDLAEIVFGKVIEYNSKEYASVYRSLVSLERKGFLQRVRIQLRWRLTRKDETK